MKTERDNQIWYPRLVDWRNWEIPRPGREAVVGFFVVLAASLVLHAFLLWICSSFRH